jgi:hypothetical protein
MKDNFRSEEFDSQISLSNMSHNTLRSSLFPDTAFKNTYRDLWSNNQLPYYLFETRKHPSNFVDPNAKNPFKRTSSNNIPKEA